MNKLLQGRIVTLENMLRNVRVIDDEDISTDMLVSAVL